MSSNTYYTNTAQYENLNGNTTVTYYSRNQQDSKAMLRAKNKHKSNAEKNTTAFVNSFFN
jgi:hypothetical protein